VRKEHIIQIISVGDFILHSSKQTALRVFHTAQQTAASPTACIYGHWGRTLFIQIQYWFMLPGLQSVPKE
jgi:hypothetical protein